MSILQDGIVLLQLDVVLSAESPDVQSFPSVPCHQVDMCHVRIHDIFLLRGGYSIDDDLHGRISLMEGHRTDGRVHCCTEERMECQMWHAQPCINSAWKTPSTDGELCKLLLCSLLGREKYVKMCLEALRSRINI